MTDVTPDQTTAATPRNVRTSLLAGLGVTLSLALAAGTVAGTTTAATPRTSTDTLAAAAAPNANALKGHRWGVYKGPADQAYKPYMAASPAERKLLAKINERPRAQWFGAWIKNGDIGKRVDEYIANATGGNPNVMVQMSIFRMVPWEHDACKRLLTKAEQASYKQWTDRAAAAIGNAHVALILQPDGPFALCAPGHSKLPSQLIAYSAKKFSALPNTNVYIDAGASDWPANNTKAAANILGPAGIRYARGFATNSTHYATTGNEIASGVALIAELNRRGIKGKHFVINTSSNGRGMTFNKAKGNHPDNANVCRTKAEKMCVTLGIPPTTDVANPRWGLNKVNKAKAAKYVDAYLWFGRPWLNMQSDPYVKSRALGLARTTPF